MATGFFTATPVKHDVRSNTEDSGMSLDGSWLNAVAVGLIDALKHSSRIDETTAKKIVGVTKRFLPELISNQPFFTPVQRLELLIKNLMKTSRKLIMIEHIAFFLRQIAVDECYENPTNPAYREVFKGLSSETPLNYLRQYNTPLHANALYALTNALALKIKVVHTQQSTDLWRKQRINNQESQVSKLELVLHAQDGLYYPAVKDESYFASVKLPSGIPLIAKELEIEKDKTVVNMLDLIAADDARLLHEYQSNRKILLSMVSAGELDLPKLQAAYRTFLPTGNSYLVDDTQFFARLADSETKVLKQPISLQQQEQAALVNAIAGWISAGLAQENELYESVEPRVNNVTRTR